MLIIGGGISGLASAYYLLHPELLHTPIFPSSSLPPSSRSPSPLQRPVVQVVEAEQRVGGWICTRRLSSSQHQAESFLFELGPRSLLTRRGDATLQLVGALGLASAPPGSSQPPQLLLSDASARRRFIWSRPRQRAVLLPTGLNASLLRFPFTATVASSVLRELLTPARAGTVDDEDESVHSFFSRRFSRVLADELIDPLIAGIYSGDASKLSVRSCFPALYQAEREHGGVLRAQWRHWRRRKRQTKPASGQQQQLQLQPDAWLPAVRSNGTYSFRDGMETLPKALQAAIEKQGGAGGENGAGAAAEPVIRTGQRVERLAFDRHGVVAVINGREERYDRVLSTVSAPALAKLLHRSSAAADTGSQDMQRASSIPPSPSPPQSVSSPAPLTSGLVHVSSPASLSSSALLSQIASSLQSLPYASVWVVSVGYDAAVLSHSGFGLLCGSSHSDDVLGIAFDSCVFPQHNSAQQQTRLTVMLGGARFPHLASLSAAEVEQRALAALQRMLGVTRPPSVVQATLTRDCIPQYVVGHQAWVRGLQQAVIELNSRLGSERLQLLGNALHGVSVNDLISESRLVAARHYGLADSQQ